MGAAKHRVLACLLLMRMCGALSSAKCGSNNSTVEKWEKLLLAKLHPLVLSVML